MLDKNIVTSRSLIWWVDQKFTIVICKHCQSQTQQAKESGRDERKSGSREIIIKSLREFSSSLKVTGDGESWLKNFFEDKKTSEFGYPI